MTPRLAAVGAASALIVLLGMTMRGTLSPSPESPGPAAAHAGRLFIAVFYLDGEIDALYQAETNRLLQICNAYGSACFSGHFSPVRRPVARLYSLPDSTGPVVGNIHAVLKLSGQEYGGLTIGLDVATPTAGERSATWMATVGDWGYGIYVSGVRPRGSWVQLFGTPFPHQPWLSLSEPAFSGEVLSIDGEILRLRSVTATSPNGEITLVRDGQYLITSVSDEVVEFRIELAADMACGETVEPPQQAPPMLRAAPAEFFDADGTPRFSFVYQKGC